MPGPPLLEPPDARPRELHEAAVESATVASDALQAAEDALDEAIERLLDAYGLDAHLTGDYPRLAQARLDLRRTRGLVDGVVDDARAASDS